MKIIVTGASKGIGLGIAQVLAQAGHQLGLIARSDDLLSTLAQQLTNETTGTARYRTANLRDPDQTATAVAHLINDLEGLDALVNNAGLVIRKPAAEISFEDYHAMIETNINGLFYTTRAALPHLINQSSGHIVNISSISGYMPLPGGSVYAATKHAVTGFSDSLLQEVRDHNIRVTTVFPGSVDSESHRHDPSADHTWKLTPQQVGQSVRHALESDPNHLVSRIEVRPLNRPPKN